MPSATSDPGAYPPPPPVYPPPREGIRAAEIRAAGGAEARDLRLTDPWLVLVLALALAGQVLVWSQISGYRLADSAEYMERAFEVAQGRALDPSTMRSFAFSALLVPYFWVADLFGITDLRGVVHAIRATQMFFGLAAVLVVARMGARLFGRAGGLACGALLAVNPVFAQYTVTPLSASAAMLFVVLGMAGMERASEPERATLRRGLTTGLWFGGSILMAFQCIPVAAAFIAFAPLRRAWRRPGHLVGLVCGVAVMLLAQATLDWWMFGTFASALQAYVVQNAGYIGANLLRQIGLEDFAIKIYLAIDEAHAKTGNVASTTQGVSMYPRDWYLTQLTSLCVVVPAAICAGVGVLRALRRPRWILVATLVVLAANVLVLSTKGSKSFRLWVPLLPLIALLAGGGWAWLFAGGGGALGRVRSSLGVLTLALGSLLGARIVLDTNLSQFSGYWKAMEIVNAHARPSRGEIVVGSAYHWAADFRAREGVRLLKLREHIDRWPNLDAEQRANLLAGFADLDWYVGHGQTLFQDPEILRAVNELFEVHAVLDDRETYEDLQPIYVLKRRTGDPDARTFFEVFTDTAGGQPNFPPLYQSRIQHPRSVRYRRPDADGTVSEMVFLGFDVDPSMVDGQQAWVTYHWYAGPLHGRRYQIIDSLTDRRGGGFFNNHEPGMGACPTTEWSEGSIVRESFLTRIAPDPWSFGGAYRRGELMPVDLWIAVVEIDAAGEQIGGLNPHLPSTAGPISRVPGPGGWASLNGHRWSPQAQLQVGGFWMPVIDERRVPDDGRMIQAQP
ncbi:ArnT family glycosyltransferase [Engelhardtia mirabilis]|uniref:Alg9-like mannosyltransferase family protein n=1 Tax=Engelhardtia mirabilis TaxID=2528011 RepID=A0A518BNP6_9BACT|nr:Alg9-like mannosyltransferase family protein [Planctomycetes bacterium Pla133]QDV02926.1 Alg9-like mannosyltransferase family protein [Planctomycetes bacterium Pla86]